MKNQCVFRIEVEGYLWRVEREGSMMGHGPAVYRVTHRRRVYARVTSDNARAAIELACRFALGCSVSIKWGSQQ